MQKMLFNRLPSVEAESQADKNQHFLGTVHSVTVVCLSPNIIIKRLVSIKSNSGMTSEKLFYSISSWKNVLPVNYLHYLSLRITAGSQNTLKQNPVPRQMSYLCRCRSILCNLLKPVPSEGDVGTHLGNSCAVMP